MKANLRRGAATTREQGFTLIELILVIGILTISIGVSSDIVLTLIKSYGKSQTNNEVEQNADFVMNRIQRDLFANAVSVTEISSNKLTFTNKNGGIYSYKVSSNGTSFQVYYTVNSVDYLLTNDDPINGIKLVDCGSSPCFTQLNSLGVSPYVIKIKFEFVPGNVSAVPSASGNTIVETTQVVRSTY